MSKSFSDALGIGGANPRAILEHLITTYGTIKKADLALNLKMISTPWNPDEDIEKVFTLGDYCRKFAKIGKDPISDTRYIQILLDIFTASGAFPEAVKKWEMEMEDEDLDAFTLHFTKAEEYRKRSSETMQDILQALRALGTSPGAPAIPLPTTFPPDRTMEGFHYCWTHGICQHPGTACLYPAEGHVRQATLRDRHGGAQNLALGPYLQAGQGQYNRPDNRRRNGRGTRDRNVRGRPEGARGRGNRGER